MRKMIFILILICLPLLKLHSQIVLDAFYMFDNEYIEVLLNPLSKKFKNIQFEQYSINYNENETLKFNRKIHFKFLNDSVFEQKIKKWYDKFNFIIIDNKIFEYDMEENKVIYNYDKIEKYDSLDWKIEHKQKKENSIYSNVYLKSKIDSLGRITDYYILCDSGYSYIDKYEYINDSLKIKHIINNAKNEIETYYKEYIFSEKYKFMSKDSIVKIVIKNNSIEMTEGDITKIEVLKKYYNNLGLLEKVVWYNYSKASKFEELEFKEVLEIEYKHKIKK